MNEILENIEDEEGNINIEYYNSLTEEKKDLIDSFVENLLNFELWTLK